MAYTAYPVNDAMAVKLWSKMAMLQALKSTPIGPLIGKSENSIIQRKDETEKGKGDRIRCTLYTTPKGDGFTEGQTVEGNAEALTNYTDDLLINELGHAVGIPSENTIDQQRVPYSLRETGRDLLSQWWADRWSESFFKQVCGFTAETDTRRTGLQAATAPTSGRILRAGDRANDESLVPGDIMTLELIDQAVEIARTADVPIRPLMINGEKKFVMYVHDFQVTSLRTNTSTGQWQDITKAALQGGKIEQNEIYTGALGEYNGVILRRAFDVQNGVNSSTGESQDDTKRAVLLGCQAAVIGFGQRGQMERMRWNEELLDHKRKLEISCWSIFGLKKVIYDNQDFGTVVVSTYAKKAGS